MVRTQYNQNCQEEVKRRRTWSEALRRNRKIKATNFSKTQTPPWFCPNLIQTHYPKFRDAYLTGGFVAVALNGGHSLLHLGPEEDGRIHVSCIFSLELKTIVHLIAYVFLNAPT